MEDVLEVYSRPPTPAIPLVCLDEFAKQLLSESRPAIPAAPGRPARHDYEYVREGSVTGFMIAMPHVGERDVFIGRDGRRTATDFAACLDHIAHRLLPGADKILLVMDNLNTHTTASLYEAFPAEKARALCERFEIHHTPKHGSWLNMAEIEIGLLARQCLNRRIGSVDEFRSQVGAYLRWKNADPKPIRWQFDNSQARVKLRSLYPSV
ncbi:IS630 family transposase ISSac1 [Haloferula sargassicola]|uniref:IS630 family transposase ISSac1 n=2 Tax=Haloferula sargassicola TaxID=490096 RepID=A0ABP9UVW3_9BACT